MGLFDSDYLSNDDDGKFDYNDSVSFFDDSDDWDDSFDDSFDQPGTSSDDDSYWTKIWDLANTPVGSGVILGAAGGALDYMAQKSRQEAYENASKEQRETIEKHNKSINKPFTGAKKGIYKRD